MLSTEKAIENGIVQNIDSNNLAFAKRAYLGNKLFDVGFNSSTSVWQPKHLYFTNNREIESNDYFLMNNCIIRKCSHVKVSNHGRGLFKLIVDIGGYEHPETACQKIEATTDKQLNLPLIPQSFIEKYVNKAGKWGVFIKEALIETETIKSATYEPCTIWQTVVKIRNNDTVIIHKLKDTFTRDEVKQLIHKCAERFGNMHVTNSLVDNWFNENS